MTPQKLDIPVNRFSGHESFCCRYGWLPKFAQGVLKNPDLFQTDEAAMLQLGIGRNMVTSIRFWAEAFGIAVGDRKGSYELTPFGASILDPSHGSDPYLEDDSTLWLLHWKISTGGRLGAWKIAFDDHLEPEVDRTKFESLVAKLAEENSRKIAPSTIRQHCDVFIRTYANTGFSTNADNSREESLGAPFQELDILDLSERSGRTVIRFRRGQKKGLNEKIFAKALFDFWSQSSPSARTLPLLSIAADLQSPGRVFKLTLSATAGLASRVAEAFSDCLIFEDDAVRSGIILRDKRSLSELEAAVGVA